MHKNTPKMCKFFTKKLTEKKLTKKSTKKCMFFIKSAIFGATGAIFAYFA